MAKPITREQALQALDRVKAEQGERLREAQARVDRAEKELEDARIVRADIITESVDDAGMTYGEIGAVFGITRQRVAQLRKFVRREG